MPWLQYEKRIPPDDVNAVQTARLQPDAHLYDIDWPYQDNQRTPSEAIRGSWQIDKSGRITDNYAVNKRYRAIIRSTRALKPYMHAAAKTNRDQWMGEIDPRAEAYFRTFQST